MTEFLTLVERFHDADRPGVATETVREYAAAVRDEMAGGEDVPFEPESLVTVVTDRADDAETWTGADCYWVGDGRVSAFPASWHDDLAGETDVTAYVERLRDPGSGDDARTPMGGAGEGVPDELLLDALGILGGVEREAAKARIEELLQSDVLAAGADQHPNRHIRLAE